MTKANKEKNEEVQEKVPKIFDNHYKTISSQNQKQN